MKSSVQRQRQAEAEEERRKDERLDELEKKVQSLSPRIKELNETMDACFENKIVKAGCWTGSPLLVKGNYQHNFPLVDRDNKKIGFAQGGSKHKIGFWNDKGQFDTDGEKLNFNIFQRNSMSEKFIRDTSIILLEGFCQQFDNFEDTFYKLVDMELEKRNPDRDADTAEKIEEDYLDER